MKRWWLFVIFILFVVEVVVAPFTGIVDGYVFNATSVVEGANVVVVVSGCTGGASNGCTGSYTSESTGYYYVGNLNDNFLQPGTATSTATVTGGSGSNTKTISNLVGQINITICYNPSDPVLTDQGNTHDTNVSLNWTSGIDPNALPVFDQFQINSDPIVNTSSPYSVSGLSYGSHTWRVRTCNAGCCSNWVSDSFIVTNSLPSAPVLTDQPHTESTDVSLGWVSGTDPDGDTTYDEFQFGTDDDFSTLISNITNATSSQVQSGLSVFTIYYWRVRTCDQQGCSSWSEDVFFVYECPEAEVEVERVVGRKGKASCIPKWECGDWGPCIDNVARRVCFDAKECVDVPEMVMKCGVEEAVKLFPIGEFYLGNLDEADIIGKEAPLDMNWIFTYLERNYTIELVERAPDWLRVNFGGYELLKLKVYETRVFDLNGDGENDVLLSLNRLKEGEAVVTIQKLVKPPRIEFPVVFVRYCLIILVLIALGMVEFIVISWLYRRYREYREEYG